MLRTLIIAALATLVAVPAASADKPDRSPAEPFGDPVTIPAGVVCDFDLTVGEVVNNGTFTTFFDKQGVPRWTHGSGKLVWRYTNEVTHRSIDVNISGPGKTVEGDDGVVHIDGTGPWGLLFFPGDDPGPLGPAPGAFIVTGHMQLEFDTNTGVFTLVGYTGKAQNVCTLLS